MTEALQYIYYFYDKFVDFIFLKMEFFTGVTFGWVCVAVFVFMILIKNIVNVPVSGVITRSSTREIKYQRSLSNARRFKREI